MPMEKQGTVENQLAHTIDQTEYDSRYDRTAKKLLANKQILAQIMKGCVNEYSDCTVDDIVEKYIEVTPEVGSVGVHVDDTNRPKKSTDVIKGSNNEDSTLTEGTLFYDVRFDAIAPKGRSHSSDYQCGSTDKIQAGIIGIHHQNYQSAYKGKPAPSDTPMTARKRLEEKRPNTFIGRSFGVGDVIVWDEEKGRKFFYVDKEELVEFGGFMDADAAGNTVIYMVPNYQIDGKTGTWLPYDSEVVEGVCFFMMRNVITSTTMLYYGQLFVKI